MTLEEIAVAGLSAGVQASYSYGVWMDTALNKSLGDGTLLESTLTQALFAPFVSRFKQGEFDSTNPANPYPFSQWNVSQRDTPEYRALARELVSSSVVLLENRGGVLPLRLPPTTTPHRILVAGPFADCPSPYGGYGLRERNALQGCSYHHSYAGQSSYVSTVLGALQGEATLEVSYRVGSFLTAPANASAIEEACEAADSADLVLLSLGLSTLIEAEGLDREGGLGLPPPQLALLTALSQRVGPARIILLLHSGGGVDVDPSLAETILQVWYGGQEQGGGVVDVLMGRVNPSARLPLSVFTNSYIDAVGLPLSDFNLLPSSSSAPASASAAGYSEGKGKKSSLVGRTYRYLDPSYQNATGGPTASLSPFSHSPPQPLVRWWFGYGESYTRFLYWDARVVVGEGGAGGNVSVSLGNIGPLEGREVVQVYVTVPPPMPFEPPAPLWSLVGFQISPDMAPGENQTLTIALPPFAFSSVVNGTREIVRGNYTVWVSGHSPGDAKASANLLAVHITI